MSNFEGFMIVGLVALCFTRFSGAAMASAALGAGATYFFVAKDNPSVHGSELWSTWVWFSYAALALIALFCYMFLNDSGGPSIGNGGHGGNNGGPHNF